MNTNHRSLTGNYLQGGTVADKAPVMQKLKKGALAPRTAPAQAPKSAAQLIAQTGKPKTAAAFLTGK